MKPKILLLDIECTPMRIWAYDLYDASALKVDQDWYITGISVKWLNGKSHTTILPDFPMYKKNKTSDKELLADILPYIEEADIIIAHNGDSFDIKKINTRLIVNGFDPLPPTKTIDTLKVAKKNFKFSSNRLDYICQVLGIGHKTPLEKEIWYKCIVLDDKKAWEKMRRYNKNDVTIMERLYYKFLPYLKSYPQFRTKTAQCPKPGCLSKSVQARGSADKPNFHRFRCNKCRGWFQEKI